jgi:acetyl-CoA acetyltransferase family protein
MSSAYIYDAVRTPFGRYGGALATERPDDLGAFVVKQIVERNGLETVDDVYFGNANGAGEDNRNVARMAALLAGLPTSVPGVTINRLCGSSLDAAMQASRAIETGDAETILVGGVESMSRAPWVVLKPERGFPAGHNEMFSTTLGWRMVNPEMPDQWTISLGESTEKLADIHNVGRDAQDAFALRSHQLAEKAWNDGFYDGWVLPVADLERDEGIRADSSLEKLAKLKPAFVKDGTVTAGNASPLNDGASAVLIAGEGFTGEPLARIAGRGTHAVDPDIFGIGPVEAANKALKRAGITWDDVDLVELNEAFAAQSIACVNSWPIDPEKVNAFGGAIAIGHPLGASGGRILGTLARGLKATGGRYGVAAICIGVGQGLAVVLEA